MSTDRNLLFGVLALQADLIDSQQFIEACTVWSTRKDTPLAELLVERDWLLPDDKSHVDYLVERKLQKHGGDARASLAAVADDLKRSLIALGDDDIGKSLGEFPRSVDSPQDVTVDYVRQTQDQYTRIRLYASGGMGHIWLARDNRLGRDVALKEIQSEKASNPRLVDRFLREAQITGQLEHPGVLPIYELSSDQDECQLFYTMRFIKGRTLSEAVQSFHLQRTTDQFDSTEFLNLLNAFVTVCNTIAYAHSRGVLHRDLKPQNVALGDFGEVVVLDWGLAKRVDECVSEDNTSCFIQRQADSKDSLTMEGQALGTPAYMAPEQAAGDLNQIDRRTDVYGLGAMLYEVLTGQPPFTGSDTEGLLRRVQQEEPQQIRHLWPDVPTPLEAICLRALEKNPENRFASAKELGQAVQQWQEIQRKQAEEALRVSEALYHSLVEAIPVNVWRKDTEGRLTFANKGFCQATHRPLSELIGKTDFDLFPPELAEKYRRDDVWVLETGNTFKATEEHITANGEKLYVEVIKVPVYDGNGKIVGTQGVFWDVTDRKRLEQTLGETKAKLDRAQVQLEQATAHSQEQ